MISISAWGSFGPRKCSSGATKAGACRIGTLLPRFSIRTSSSKLISSGPWRSNVPLLSDAMAAASFVDRYQQTRIGKIVRLNLKTATLECHTGEWRVSYGLLQHVVDL